MRQEFQENSEEKLPVLFLEAETLPQEETNSLETEGSLAPLVRKGIRDFRWNLFRGVLFTGVAFAVIVNVFVWLIRNQNLSHWGLFTLALAMIGAFVVALIRSNFHKAIDNVKASAKSEDVEALGAMIDMLELEKELKLFDATISITNILSNIQPEHAGLLSSRHRAILRGLLNRNFESLFHKDLSYLFQSNMQPSEANRRAINLRVAIMKGFAQIGTEAEVSCLERWASIEAKSEAQRILKSTAMECLPLLKGRVAQLSDQNTLLRASDANHHDPNLLLRPSREVAEPSEQLLRPNETPL